MNFDPFTLVPMLVQPVALFVGTLALVLVLRRVLFGVLRRWAAGAESQLAELVSETFSGSILLWGVILAFHVATQDAEIPKRLMRYVHPAVDVLWVWSITAAVSRFAGRAVRHYGTPVTGVKSVTSLTQKLVQLAVVTVGLVWLLKVVFDISLTPILTTLGVGGLAVALALQDTLSNLFAGFYVSISGLVNLGDYIRLNTGEEGYVTDITWRCTTMRTNGNNLTIIPNNKLAQAIYTNYHLPETRMGVSMIFNVAMSSDVVRVLAVLSDEILQVVNQVPGALAEPVASVRFNGPGEHGLAFQVNCNITKFTDQFQAMSDLRTLLFTRLQREGIRFDVPPKAVILDSQQQAGD